MKVIALLLILTIAGCSTVGGSRGSSEMAGLECGAVGAGLSAALCLALGGNAATCGGAAAGGGLLAAGVCYTYAEKAQKRREELVGKENDLDARLIYVRGLNEDSKKANEDLGKQVARVSRHTDTVVAQMKKGTISQEELIKERENLLKIETLANDQVEIEKSALDDMKRFQAEQKQKAAGNAAMHAKLDEEIKEQERLLEDTKRQTNALASQRQRI